MIWIGAALTALGWALALSPNLLDGAIGRASVVVGVITIVRSLIDYAKEKR